jgi:putative addiction module component (TIGR02574 family)
MVDLQMEDGYAKGMSDPNLIEQLMSLPPDERAELAEALWESIGDPSALENDADSVKNALRRDAELTSGQTVGRTHDEVMQSARRAIGCDSPTIPKEKPRSSKRLPSTRSESAD